jgi:hypothetical protein
VRHCDTAISCLLIPIHIAGSGHDSHAEPSASTDSLRAHILTRSLSLFDAKISTAAQALRMRVCELLATV